MKWKRGVLRTFASPILPLTDAPHILSPFLTLTAINGSAGGIY